MTELQLHSRILEIFSELEARIAVTDKPNEGGVVTEHMGAVWAARDKINELFDGPDRPTEAK